VIVKASVSAVAQKMHTTKVESRLSFAGKHVIEASDYRTIVKKLYYEAMKHIKPDKKYKFATTFNITRSDTHETFYVVMDKFEIEPHGVNKTFTKWYYQALLSLENIFNKYPNLKDMKAEFVFTEILSGSGKRATEDKDRESIYNKTSVNKIINDDNSCFWHSLAVSLNKDHPKYSDIRKGRNIRTSLAKELCNQCCMKWDTPVSVDEIPIVEAFLKLNIYVLDIENLPMLNTTLNIYDSMIYKSKYEANFKQCWLLMDGDHYNVINNIKGFLAVDYFCHKCLSCIHHKEVYDTHKCHDETGPETKKKTSFP
jgi:hypothetical protein